MTSTLQNQLDDLQTKTASNIRDRGVDIVTKGEVACRLLMLWIQYLRSYQLTGTADCLIDATSSAAREGVTCLTLGLVRPALSSLRGQIDMALAWLYFKDHPIEWGRVQDTGDGFKMKTELLKYLGDSFVRYGNRFGILRDCRTRRLVDPYRLLSAHIHGQSELALPTVQIPADIIAIPDAQFEAIALQEECSEFISDVFWSVFADSWSSLPSDLQKSLETRFKSSAQRAAFFT